MAVTYNIVPIPRWYFADNFGKPLGGGYMSTWRSIDKVTPKPVYTDSTGVNTWPNPVFFDANGEAPGPFFWASDEPYFLEVFAADNTLLFTMDNYGPAIAGGGGGGGGGGTVNVFNNIENFVLNNVFWRNQGTLNNIQNGTVIAPSNHEGFVYAPTGFSTIPFVGPDIMFVRNNNTSTDNLVFTNTDFAAGLVPLTGDITPETYINLTCVAAGNETLKAIQFPIDLHVKNLEQQTMTAMIWAKGNSGTQNLTMNLVQYFGTGSATTPVVTAIPINASPLQGTWQPYVANFVIPSVAGKTLGLGGDDATYLQVNFPTALPFSISVTKPKLYLGTIGTVFPELQTYDNIDRVISSPRTGDIRVSMNNFAPYGWISMNDTTIGSGSSGATGRANIDTWQLYSLLYVNVSDTYAPVSGGRTAPGNTVAAAYADFTANKPLALTKTLGRALASVGQPSAGGSGTTWALGQTTGEENHTLTINEMPAHNHPGSTITGTIQNYCSAGGSSTYNTTGLPTSANVQIASQGGGAGHNTIQPTTYMNVFIKL